MKVFVWNDMGRAYFPGFMIAVAETIEEAREMLSKELAPHNLDWLDSGPDEILDPPYCRIHGGCD